MRPDWYIPMISWIPLKTSALLMAACLTLTACVSPEQAKPEPKTESGEKTSSRLAKPEPKTESNGRPSTDRKIDVSDPVDIAGQLAGNAQLITNMEADAKAGCAKDPTVCYWTGALYAGKALNEQLKNPESIAKARHWLQTGCDGKDLVSCNLLGEELIKGRVFKQETEKGKALLKKNCDEGFLPSCFFLGKQALAEVIALRRFGQLDQAVSYSKRAAEGGVSEAMGHYVIALAIQKKLAGTFDEITPPRLEQKCEKGDGEACLLTAVIRAGMENEKKGKAKEPTLEGVASKQLPLFHKGCSLNNGVACVQAGHYSAKAKDAAAALHFFEKACASGNQAGCAELAWLGLKVKATPASKIIAAGASACRAGIASACFLPDSPNANPSQPTKPAPGTDGLYAHRKACALHDQNACLMFLMVAVPLTTAKPSAPSPVAP